MVLYFIRNLPSALRKLQSPQYLSFPVSSIARTIDNSCELLSKYGDINWRIVDLLNQRYETNFDLMHWLESANNDAPDEIATFLHEAGSNVLSDSEYKIPFCYHLWLGAKGFIIGIEQQGAGFNALSINKEKVKRNQGAAFTFFRSSKSTIFFDNPRCARIVFVEYHLPTQLH